MEDLTKEQEDYLLESYREENFLKIKDKEKNHFNKVKMEMDKLFNDSLKKLSNKLRGEGVGVK